MNQTTAEERPPCMRCGGPHSFDTSIPSVVWNEVIRAAGLDDYLCLACIVREFVLCDRSFTAELFGDGLHGPSIEVVVRGQRALDAAKISEENTALRQKITTLEADLKAAEEREKQLRAENYTDLLDQMDEAWGQAHTIGRSEINAFIETRRVHRPTASVREQLAAAEERAQKAEAQDTCDCGHAKAQHEGHTQAVGAPPPNHCSACSCKKFISKRRAYAVRVLEEEADRLDKITDDQEAAWEAAGLYEHETSDLDPWCLRNLADRIKAGEV